MVSGLSDSLSAGKAHLHIELSFRETTHCFLSDIVFTPSGNLVIIANFPQARV